jgi:hypothetical protein
MSVRRLHFIRNFIAGLQNTREKKARTSRRRSRPLTLETLEERLTPSAGVQEQYMLDLINRFRQNPAAELTLILNANDANVNNDLAYFHVDRTVLAAQWPTLTAPPLAWNDSLASAALAHSQAMLAAQDQSHQVANEADAWTRIVNAGYTNYTFLAENIFAFAQSTFEAEASFAIDWGDNPPTGIQPSASHRANLMNANLREIGIGIVSAPSGSVMGPLLFTQDFGNRSTIGNPFLLGNVYDDTNHDGFYEPGEGMAGVTLTITGPAGSFQAITTAAGGYQLQVPAGTYQVTASGGGMPAPVTQNVTVGANNVQADFVRPQVPAPTFTGPAASTTSTTPVFAWTATPGATAYDLWVNNVTTGQQAIRNQNLTTNTFTPATPLPAGSYQAWIRVTTGGSTSPWSPAYNFTITPPAIPTLTAPIGATSTSTPTFTWSASTDAARYDLYISNLTTGQITRQQSLTINSFTPTSALATGSYQAWVQAFNSAGNSAGWSAGISFTLTGAAAPTLTAPTGSSSNNSPTFNWTATSGATGYDLWVNNLSTGQNQVIRQQNVTGTTFTPANPLPAGSYVAWVQAFNGSGPLGGWSAGLNFTIVAPAAPTVTAPAAVITSTTPTFTWNASAGATQYDVWADNLTTGQTQVVRQTVTANSLTPASPIPRGQYVVWVRAGNSTGDFGQWSAGYGFLIDTTAPAIPTITAPGSPTPLVTPTITWSASTGATRYDLWVDNLSSGQAQVIRQNLTANTFMPTTPLKVGSYVAWVQAFDNANQTRGWSASFNFTVTLPAAPGQITPMGSTTNATPTFSWGVVVGAARYDLWVDLLANDVIPGQQQIIRQQNLTTNSFTQAMALAKGNYRFWVRAINANGDASNWSAEVDFTIV